MIDEQLAIIGDIDANDQGVSRVGQQLRDVPVASVGGITLPVILRALARQETAVVLRHVTAADRVGAR